jgi:uncharacterized protein (TIGR02217 family)
MAFLETPRFPAKIAFRAIGGPGFLTQVAGAASGYEQRLSLWQFARGTWDVGSVTDTLTNYVPLRNFFRAVGGKRDGFRFQDYSDYLDEGYGVLGLTGLGDGTTITFQMYKNYVAGANKDQRQIRKPLSGTCAFFDNGSPASPTVDYTTGLVSFGSAPTSGHALTWTGQFDVPCRFDVDEIKLEITSRAPAGGDLLLTWPQIPLIEIRV